jgi:hypothetical protein
MDFLIASKISGISLRNFAKSLGYSPALISMVLSGNRKNTRVSNACRVFINRYFFKMKFQTRGGVSAQAAHGHPINQITPRVLNTKGK